MAPAQNPPVIDFRIPYTYQEFDYINPEIKFWWGLPSGPIVPPPPTSLQGKRGEGLKILVVDG